MRTAYPGAPWGFVKTRSLRCNTGELIRELPALGAQSFGDWAGRHVATIEELVAGIAQRWEVLRIDAARVQATIAAHNAADRGDCFRPVRCDPRTGGETGAFACGAARVGGRSPVFMPAAS